MSKDFLEFGIVQYVEEFENLTIYIHLKDKAILSFDNVTRDPILYQGWINIYHKWFNVQEACSMIPASDFSYVTYVTKERKGKPDEDDGTEDGFQ